MEQYFLSLIRGERRGVWPCLQRGGLRAVSIPYGWAVRLRNRLFERGLKKAYRAAVPVVSVGNLTARRHRQDALRRVRRPLLPRPRPARGHPQPRLRQRDGAATTRPWCWRRTCPTCRTCKGPTASALARTAVEELESEVLVLDDGFQHRRLARDLDLVLIDATDPWGHGHLFPRGLLREPPRGCGGPAWSC